MVIFRKNPWKYIFSVVGDQVVISREKKYDDEHNETKLSLFVFADVLNGGAFRFSPFLQGRGIKLTPEEIEKFKQDPDFTICFNSQPKKEPKIKQPKPNYSYLILQEIRKMNQILLLILNTQSMTPPDTKKIETKTPIADNPEPKPPPEPIKDIRPPKNITEKMFIYKRQRILSYEFCKVHNDTLQENEIRIKLSDTPDGHWLTIIPYEDFERFFIKTESNPDYKNKYLSRDKNTVTITGKLSAPILLNLDPTSLNIIRNFLNIKVKDNPVPTFVLDDNTTYKGDPASARKTQTRMPKNEIVTFIKNHRATLAINGIRIWIEPKLDSNGVVLYVPLNSSTTKPEEEYKGFIKRIDKANLKELTRKMSQIFKGDLIESFTTISCFHIEDYKVYYQDKNDKRHPQRIYLFDNDKNSVEQMKKYFD